MSVDSGDRPPIPPPRAREHLLAMTADDLNRMIEHDLDLDGLSVLRLHRLLEDDPEAFLDYVVKHLGLVAGFVGTRIGADAAREILKDSYAVIDQLPS
jgi:hypothetical protein